MVSQVPKTVCYEQPLNEKTRTLLRLEFLFAQLAHAVQGSSPWDTRAALQVLFDILTLTSRSELKSEIGKELERHSLALGRLRQTPAVDTGILETVLEELDRVRDQVRGIDPLAIEALRQNDFLTPIRQRSSIPGGTCTFDLPALHHWLQSGSEACAQQITDWLRPLAPLQEGVQLLLRLIRDSATPHETVAVHGFFQKTLNSTAPNQLVRVILPVDLEVFPEISGGKHRFSIRFMVQPTLDQRASQSTDDIDFWLACCVI